MNVARSTPVLLLAIRGISEADRENLDRGLRQLQDEDPTLSVNSDQQTGEVTIGAVGELQLEIVVDRLRREFHVEATVGRPQVAYKEALTQAADGEGLYARQTGGLGQYGHAKIHVSPGEPGSGYVFKSVLIGGAIPNHFIEPIKVGIQEASARGVIAGYRSGMSESSCTTGRTTISTRQKWHSKSRARALSKTRQRRRSRFSLNR